MLKVVIGNLYTLRGDVYKVLSVDRRIVKLQNATEGGICVVGFTAFALEAEDYKFNPITEFEIINGPYKLTAYSDKSVEELHTWLQDNMNKRIYVKAEDGSPLALLSPEFLRTASFIYNPAI